MTLFEVWCILGFQFGSVTGHFLGPHGTCDLKWGPCAQRFETIWIIRASGSILVLDGLGWFWYLLALQNLQVFPFTKPMPLQKADCLWPIHVMTLFEVGDAFLASISWALLDPVFGFHDDCDYKLGPWTQRFEPILWIHTCFWINIGFGIYWTRSLEDLI